MHSRSIEVLPEVILGQSNVVVTRGTSSKRTVAGILGTEVDPQTGLRTIWLDRVVHRRGEHSFQGADARWQVAGAISSILKEEGVQQ